MQQFQKTEKDKRNHGTRSLEHIFFTARSRKKRIETEKQMYILQTDIIPFANKSNFKSHVQFELYYSH